MTWRAMVWVATGVVWAFRSVLSFTDPDYRSPVTSLDWSAVWSFSIAWILMAASLALLAGRDFHMPTRSTAAVGAAFALLAGIANGIEDGLGMRDWGTLYVIGSLGLIGALIVTAFMFWFTDRRPPATALVVMLIGLFFTVAGGGVLVLAAFVGLVVIDRKGAIRSQSDVRMRDRHE